MNEITSAALFDSAVMREKIDTYCKACQNKGYTPSVAEVSETLNLSPIKVRYHMNKLGHNTRVLWQEKTDSEKKKCASISQEFTLAISKNGKVSTDGEIETLGDISRLCFLESSRGINLMISKLCSNVKLGSKIKVTLEVM